MEFDLRLKALSRLSQSQTDAAATALRTEFEKVAASLPVETQYDLITQNLEILGKISHRFSTDVVQLLLVFIETIPSRQITYSDQQVLLAQKFGEYYSTSSLIIRSVELLTDLRYLETKTVLHALLRLSNHPTEVIREKAVAGLKALVNYDMHVIYGDGKLPGIGVTPQKQAIDELESLEDIELHNYFSVIVALVDEILSPTAQGVSWSYKSVTWSQSATPGHPTMADIRQRSIALLKRMYGLAKPVSQKLEIIYACDNATRTHPDSNANDETIKMIGRDTIEVLKFFSSLVQTEDLQIIQKIESKSYWIYHHASARPEIEAAAMAVQATIADHSEYQIYKVLIGFEGVFLDWAEFKKLGSLWEGEDEFRRAKALEYVDSITAENYTVWRQRIFNYAETKSADLATFPVFYQFLRSFAEKQPTLALQLISENAEPLAAFLIPLLRGLWIGPKRSETKTLIESWAANGQHLFASTKQFLASENLDLDLLKLLLRRATDLNDLETVNLMISVAITNFSPDKEFLVDELFLPALEVLTERSNTGWILDVWFRRETRTVIKYLSEHHLDLVLRNLLALKEIDYHAEEVLYLIAQRAPGKVLRFLCQRLIALSDNRRIFDAIPFTMHKLKEPLSKMPREAVRVVREQYDGNYSKFIHRGAHLLKTIFPDFPAEFEAELLTLVRVEDDANLEFVLAILRNYTGEPSLHRVCKEIIKAVPMDSPLRTEVAIVLENTGVVVGEFGLADAYERKKSEVNDWINDPDERIQEFAKWYIASLEQMSTADRKRAEEEIALRKYRYGEEE